jgi:hypothetical protein
LGKAPDRVCWPPVSILLGTRYVKDPGPDSDAIAGNE